MEYPAAELATTLRRWIETFMRRSMQSFMRFTRENGLSMPQVNAMFFLSRKEPCGVSDLAMHLGITSAAASQMVEKMVQQGFLERCEDRRDRRLKQISLTAKGRQVMEDTIRAREQWIDQIAKVITPTEQAQIVTALEILIDKFHLLDQVPGSDLHSE